jgi:isoquinoline 1-oxidoreductase beta subunit
LGLKPAQVRLHTILGGGSFGRRTTGGSEHIVEVAEIAKAINGRAPVRMLHTRTDDIQGGGYRPMFVHRVRGAVDGKGGILAWEHRLVGQSLAIGTSAEKFLVKDGIDRSSVEGISDMPYATANLQVESHNLVTGVPILYWRSVSHSHNAFAKEAFVDALAAASGIDAVKFRLDLLAAHPRQQAVLRLAAAKAGWGTPMAKGRGRGVAVQESFGSFVAHVAEVTVTPEGGLKVDRIVCAIDCGIAVNPDIVRQQMEGGTGWGFGHALRDAITLTGGVVDQSNFDTYEPLRFSDMPAIEVHIMPSAAAPSGVGETAVPTSAPAVANAVFAASGRRLQTLPFGMTAAA